MKKKREPTSRCKDWPSYWFVALENAAEQGDFEGAAIAQRELARLGVSVTYRRHITKPQQEPKT